MAINIHIVLTVGIRIVRKGGISMKKMLICALALFVLTVAAQAEDEPVINFERSTDVDNTCMIKIDRWNPERSTEFRFNKRYYEDVDWIEHTDTEIIVYMKVKKFE